MRDLARWTPLYGVAELARAPLTHARGWSAVLNVVGWLTILVTGASWRMRRDPVRV